MKNWIAGAISHPGALKRKAKKAGESTMEFARGHDEGSSTTAKQSRLAETLARLRRGKRGRGKKAPSGPRAQAAMLEGGR